MPRSPGETTPSSSGVSAVSGSAKWMGGAHGRASPTRSCAAPGRGAEWRAARVRGDARQGCVAQIRARGAVDRRSERSADRAAPLPRPNPTRVAVTRARERRGAHFEAPGLACEC
jgi:hypothetical protein